MGDIVKRLRAVNQDVTQPWKLCEEAAAEIEQLREELDVNRTALEMKHAEIERLQAKLSKAVEALALIENAGLPESSHEEPVPYYMLRTIARATLKEVGGA